ncbi:MAG TPA: cytochrome c oxidase assembly protein [candidate division Zixibacteria bacterium]|nr:cytochrome c oxidase assembly protein [candidate division Zixibacteria bacterium]
MGPSLKSFFSALVAAAVLALPACYLHVSDRNRSPSGRARVVERYVRATYARNFSGAHRWLSAADRRAKSVRDYALERGELGGFTALLAARLADLIEIAAVEESFSGRRAKMKLKVKAPDPDRLAADLLGWDEERLNALSAKEQRELLAMIERRRRAGSLPFVETEETYDLVEEEGGWRIVLDPSPGVRVRVLTKLPPSSPLRVESVPGEIVFRPGEPFTVTLRVRNPSNREIWARVAHNAEPKLMEKFIGLGDCGVFVPFRLAPGEEEENRSTFLVWTDMPREVDRFTMIYTFEIDD